MANLLDRLMEMAGPKGELQLRDPGFVAEVDATFGCAGRPPMFTPFRLRELELANRVVVSPMDMYSSRDGTPGDFHLVHLGARGIGGAGLVIASQAGRWLHLLVRPARCPSRTRLVRPGPGARGLCKAWAPAWLIAGPVLAQPTARPAASAGPGSAEPGSCTPPDGCTMQPAGLIPAGTEPDHLALPSLCHTGPASQSH